MNKNTSAAQTLDLDKLQGILDAAGQGAQTALIPADVLSALIAQARAAQPAGAADSPVTTVADTTASDKQAECLHCGKGVPEIDNCEDTSFCNISMVQNRAAHPVQAGEAIDERALFEGWAKSVGYNVQAFKAEDETAYSATFANVAWEGFKACRATLAPVATQQADWHAAVLAECMRIEAAYKADDPVATLKALIDYHANSSDIAVTNKVLADNYLRSTCSAPVDSQQAAAVAAPSELREIIKRIREAAQHWGGWSGTQSNCDRALAILDGAATAVAATTSEDARDAALEEAARICEHTYVEPGDMQVAPCTEAAAAIRALKSAMRATQQEGGNE